MLWWEGEIGLEERWSAVAVGSRHGCCELRRFGRLLVVLLDVVLLPSRLKPRFHVTAGSILPRVKSNTDEHSGDRTGLLGRGFRCRGTNTAVTMPF